MEMTGLFNPNRGTAPGAENSKRMSPSLDPKFFWKCTQSYLAVLAAVLLVGGISWFRRAEVLSGNSDFASFYTCLKLIRTYGPSRLYDLEIQRQVQREILGNYTLAGGLLPFSHPPFELFFLLPLSYFSYKNSYLIWLGINFCSILLLPRILCSINPKVLGKSKMTLLLSALAHYPFLVCFWQGQDSILLLWLLVGFFLLLKRGFLFWAGAILGLAFIKFHIAYLIAGMLILKRRSCEILGLFSSLGILCISSLSVMGLSGARSYFRILLKVNHEFSHSLAQMQNWSGQLFLAGFTGVQRLWGLAVVCLLALALLGVIWRIPWDTGHRYFGLSMASTLLLALLGSPHLYIHDLSVIFLPASLCLEFLLLSEARHKKWWILASLIWVSPLIWIFSLFVSLYVPVQLSVVWMTLVLGTLIAIAKPELFPGDRSLY